MSEDIVFIICATILVILCTGEPDIIDGMAAMLNNAGCKP